MRCLVESLLIIRWLLGFEAKDFNSSTSWLLKHHPCFDNLGIVENQKTVFWKVLRNAAKFFRKDIAFVVNQELGQIAMGEWVFGYSLIRQIISIIGYWYLFLHGKIIKIIEAAKIERIFSR